VRSVQARDETAPLSVTWGASSRWQPGRTVFPEDQANQLLREAEEQDVTAGGTFSAGPAGVQVWSEPWNGEGGTRGSSVHLGSVDWTYNTPTRFCITVYRCMVTQEGRNRGLEAADVLKQILDLVGPPIDGVRANLHEPLVTDPFRAASGTG
jgi:hypothetical protein